MADRSSANLVIDGLTCTFVYDDALAPLVEEGRATTVRASHVEPVKDGTGWVADMKPSGGPVLGPFRLRQDALDAEREWLSKTWGL